MQTVKLGVGGSMRLLSAIGRMCMSPPLSLGPPAARRMDFHSSATLLSKKRHPARCKTDLPNFLDLSHGRMVYRGMLPKEPVTGYTHKPLQVIKTGGRGTDGRVEVRRIGGGKPVVWHMADLNRIREDEPDPKVEVIKDIIPEQTRSSYLALAVGGEHKRWIIATEFMKVGDIIKSTRHLPVMPIQAQPGDCHPVGALPIGSQVCCVERFPYQGSKVANGAGTSALIVKKIGNKVTLKMPSKREMVVDEKCLCVVGRCSNTERNKRILGKAGAARWLGIRPKSGLRMKKTGLHGRKLKRIPRPVMYEKPAAPKPPKLTYTVSERLFEKRRGLVQIRPY